MSGATIRNQTSPVLIVIVTRYTRNLIRVGGWDLSVRAIRRDLRRLYRAALVQRSCDTQKWRKAFLRHCDGQDGGGHGNPRTSSGTGGHICACASFAGW